VIFGFNDLTVYEVLMKILYNDLYYISLNEMVLNPSYMRGRSEEYKSCSDQ
jgi:hypothetical protein